MCDCGFPDNLTDELFSRQFDYYVMHIWIMNDETFGFFHVVDSKTEPTYETRNQRIN